VVIGTLDRIPSPEEKYRNSMVFKTAFRMLMKNTE
jgi:hypothetical protein